MTHHIWYQCRLCNFHSRIISDMEAHHNETAHRFDSRVEPYPADLQEDNEKDDTDEYRDWNEGQE